MDENYFRNNFNTPLSPQELGDYQLWLAEQGMRRGRDLSKDEAEYDMRGYFKAGKDLDNAEGHFPDTFKKPNHPTFSVESQYHGRPGPDGAKFEGGVWAPDGKSYTPSATMLQRTHKPDFLQRYFQDVEPGVQLVLPK